MKKQTKIIILHTSYSSYYRDKNNTNVVPMLYPVKRKSPYITYIQAFENVKSDPDRIRTCDPQLRRLLLYPAELLDLFDLRYLIYDIRIMLSVINYINQLQK